MIRSFLLLFPQFRSLEAEYRAALQESADLRTQLQDQTTQALLLQDRLDSALSDRSQLWEMTKECINHERGALQMHINETWQKQYGVAPYPEAMQIPKHSVPHPVENPMISRTALPSEGVRQRTVDFVKNYYENSSIE